MLTAKFLKFEQHLERLLQNIIRIINKKLNHILGT